MAWTRKQSAVSTGIHPQLTGVKFGSLLVLGVSIVSGTNSITSITDSTGDTWSHCTNALATNNASLNERPDFWYCSKVGGCSAGTHTLTLTVSGGSNAAFDIMEFTGQTASADPFDTAITGQGSGANPSVSITPTNSNSLVIGYIVDASAPSAAGTGFVFDTGSPFASNWNEAVEYKTTASGATTVQYTVASNNYCMSAVSFSPPTLFDVGFDFRSSSGFVTDPVFAQVILGSEIYPTTTTINGFSVTYGWDNSIGGNARDRDNTVDPRLAGIEFNGAGTWNFRVDLPATGGYNVGLAVGDAAGGNAQVNYVKVLDNATSFVSFQPINTTGAQFADAAGNFWSKTTWPGSNVSVAQTFVSTVLKVQISDGGAGASTCLVHLRITASGSTPPATANRAIWWW